MVEPCNQAMAGVGCRIAAASVATSTAESKTKLAATSGSKASPSEEAACKLAAGR